MKRKYIKGFTLVEIIVVLAILAILAAMLVPSLTGYIDKAKKKKDIATARNILTAAQTTTSELWALNQNKVCDAGNNTSEHPCSVIIPLSNDITRPNSGDENILRYYMTYDLIEEAFNQNEKFYIAFLVEKGVIIKTIYYPDDEDYCFIWTKENQEWEETVYKTSLWDELYSYCGYPNYKPNWNGGSAKYPNNKTVS